MRRVRGSAVLGGVFGRVSGGAAATLLAMLCVSPVYAQQPPGPDCRRASKIEYDSAKREYLLRHKFGAYVRTGHFWHRYYWYCRI